jgi:hypothetical protein
MSWRMYLYWLQMIYQFWIGFYAYALVFLAVVFLAFTLCSSAL